MSRLEGIPGRPWFTWRRVWKYWQRGSISWVIWGWPFLFIRSLGLSRRILSRGPSFGKIWRSRYRISTGRMSSWGRSRLPSPTEISQPRSSKRTTPAWRRRLSWRRSTLMLGSTCSRWRRLRTMILGWGWWTVFCSTGTSSWWRRRGRHLGRTLRQPPWVWRRRRHYVPTLPNIIDPTGLLLLYNCVMVIV